MTPAFGFSFGDFVTAIELCAKVAKALKDSGVAAAEYQHVILELQGLQNILTRLAALEPTASNIQHVNVIRGAALASTLALQDFLSKLEKYDSSMSPFAAKTKFSLSRAGKQAQYALFMADDIKKMRAIIYGNVIRIHLVLATQASETLSTTEKRLANQHEDLVQRFQDTRSEMANLAREIAGMRAETLAYGEQARQDSISSARNNERLSNQINSNNTTVVQKLSNLSAGISSVRNSVSGLRDLSAQIISLLSSIPIELGCMIQSVIRSNARIESMLLGMQQRVPASPSLLMESNIRLEDALGRVHADIPFEWFQYWETFEGLLKARFKDTPGRQKVENGEYRLVHAARPSISLARESWSAMIGPGTQIVMLMLVSTSNVRNSACPRRSCSGRVVPSTETASLSTCSKCDVRFRAQNNEKGTFDADANEVLRLQRTEDAKLFGKRTTEVSREIIAITEDIEMMDVDDLSRADMLEGRLLQPADDRRMFKVHPLTSSAGSGLAFTTLADLEPPIFSWLSQTVPPRDPAAVRDWREETESGQAELREREASDLEVFRNVQIMMPAEMEAPGIETPTSPHIAENDLKFGARIYYRNILDQYPDLDSVLARRLANSNWLRQKQLAAKQGEAERARWRAQFRERGEDQPRKRKSSQLQGEVGKMTANVDEWEDISDREADNDRQPVYPSHQNIEGHRGYARPERFGDIDLPSPVHPGPQMAKSPRVADTHPWNHPYQYLDALAGSDFSAVPWTDPVYNLFTRKRRVGILPPLPRPLEQAGLKINTMMCYLCYSEVQICTKVDWRLHVMNDLKPYVCPLTECLETDLMFSSRTKLLKHMQEHVTPLQNLHVSCRCPFCDIEFLALEMEIYNRTYIKHIGRHMEEVAFSVATTAYSDWSYDESGSDEALISSWQPHSSRAMDGSLPFHQFDANLMFADSSMMVPLTTEAAEPPDSPTWYDASFDRDRYEMNVWTGEMTAVSPASSANSGLRDPPSPDFYARASRPSESDDEAQINVSTSRHSFKLRRQHASKHSRVRAGEKRVGRRKGPLTPDQRKQANEIRKLRHCLRCKFLKKTCDKGDPCTGCQPSTAKRWRVPCTRMEIKDLGYFLKQWKCDYERHVSLDFSMANIKGFSDVEKTVFITHGYGSYLCLKAREVYVYDERSMQMDWVEGNRAPQGFEIRTDKLSLKVGEPSTFLLSEYLDHHIDFSGLSPSFDHFMDKHFQDTAFMPDILKCIYIYYQRTHSEPVRKALKLFLAYNLTLHITLIESPPAHDKLVGKVEDKMSKLCGKVIAPVMINFQIKCAMADTWRELHADVLRDLSTLYAGVYSGDKLKNWPTIFMLDCVLLAVWECMQFDCHYRLPDPAAVQKFCTDMETTPVAVIIGLFHAISSKLPLIRDWDSGKHQALFGFDDDVCHLLTSVSHSIRHYEPYLSQRKDAKFDPLDFDSLSNKFLSQLVLPYNPPLDTE